MASRVLFNHATITARSFSRNFVSETSATGKGAFAAEREAIEKHASAHAKRWLLISTWVCIPATFASAFNAYRIMKEHEAHKMHLDHEEMPHYPYLRIRTKQFWWGDGEHTLFHNPAVNGP